MEKTLLEQLKDARISNEPAYVSFFNNGNTRVDERIAKKRMDYYSREDTLRYFKYMFCDAAESYARKYPYDSISMGLEIGLIFDINDIDEDNKIKENAKPINGIVRIYSGDINCYLNGEKSNTDGYYGYGKQGFADYDELVKNMKHDGLSFEGPQSFEEFKNAILSGENFDIALSANLIEEKVIKEEPQEEHVKKLSKRSFFRRR